MYPMANQKKRGEVGIQTDFMDQSLADPHFEGKQHLYTEIGNPTVLSST